MAGFLSPAVLFINTFDSPERRLMRGVFTKLPQRGYRRYVELCCGAFSMPTVAAEAGWPAGQMDTSDVGLYSSIVGTVLDPSRRLEELGVRVDGELLPVEGDKLEAGAWLLWLQLLLRTEAKPPVAYWRGMVRDLRERKAEHIGSIRSGLSAARDRLTGLRYRPLDLWRHVEEVADDPETFIYAAPPTYKAGFERFFDTKGRLTWDEPEYGVYDPRVDTARLTAHMRDRAALFICWQQQPPRRATEPTPIFARPLAQGTNVYMVANRPAEVFEMTGGPKVVPRKRTDLTPADVSPLPLDHEITAESRLEVAPIKAAVADYYRGLWLHRLNAAPGGSNGLVLLDGYAAGVIGYNEMLMSTFGGPGAKWGRRILLRFSTGAPHERYRMTRLITMVALLRSTRDRLMTGGAALFAAASDGVVTMEMTRHPESKLQRGLMELAERQKHQDGYKLAYVAPWRENDSTVLAEFAKKEAQWWASRQR